MERFDVLLVARAAPAAFRVEPSALPALPAFARVRLGGEAPVIGSGVTVEPGSPGGAVAAITLSGSAAGAFGFFS
jgi:hypothetical protein